MAAASAGGQNSSGNGHQQQHHQQQRITYISRVPTTAVATAPQESHEQTVRMNYNLAPGWKRLLANGEIIYLR